MYAVDAICQFALEFHILWCQLGAGFFVRHFLQLAKELAFLLVVIAVVGGVAVALLPGLSPSCFFGSLVSEGRESNCAAGLQGPEVGEVYLA